MNSSDNVLDNECGKHQIINLYDWIEDSNTSYIDTVSDNTNRDNNDNNNNNNNDNNKKRQTPSNRNKFQGNTMLLDNNTEHITLNGNSNSNSNSYKQDGFYMIDHFHKDIAIKRSKWVRDDLVSSCEICNVDFSIFKRRHHCRCCGKIFCYSCTSNFVIIPDLENALLPIKSIKHKEKVCNFCYEKIVDFRCIEKIYIILSNIPLDIYDISKLSIISRSWNKVYKYYSANYKKILDKSHTDIFSEYEINFLWLNRQILSGHNKWLIQFIKVVETYYATSTTSATSATSIITRRQIELLNLLIAPKNTCCEILKCKKECRLELATEDAILCLALPMKYLVTEPYLMRIICSGNINELQCYLPCLVDILKYRDTSNALANYLFKIASSNYLFANFLFWEITVQMEYNPSVAIYEKLMLSLTDSLPEVMHDNLKKSFYFVENLTEMVSNMDKFPVLLEAYFNTLHDTGIQTIRSPVNPEIMLKHVCQKDIRVRGSSSRPISIPFLTCDENNQHHPHKIPKQPYNNNYELLYKKDDVRKDLIIMNIIKLVDIILKRDEKLDLHITTYNILPTSSKTGFIEIVRDAETILGINKRKKFSILNFILEHNPDKSVEQIRAKFTKSCVAYCILSYLLGIGDRHMENIMVKPSGEIFHIDFGFILGADPKPLAPEIRITDEMVDAMGGYESRHYARFKELCARSFLCLRKNISVFRCMFSSFTRANPPIDKKLTKEYIDKFITNKFLVGENCSNAKLYLINKVSTRSRGYSESLIDFCHQAQDSTSVINSSLTNSAMNLGSSILGMFWK